VAERMAKNKWWATAGEHLTLLWDSFAFWRETVHPKRSVGCDRRPNMLL
jgi:hypothetical protein